MNTRGTDRAGRRCRAGAALLAAWLLPVTGIAALAADAPPAAREIGWVSADPILDLIEDEQQIKVEINVGPALLRMIAAGAGDTDPALRDAIEGLREIRTLVLDLSGSEAGGRADRTVLDLIGRLQRDGWERTAVVRDETSNVNVLLRVDDEGRARGLVVLILEREAHELVFVNLHGILDLSRLAEIEAIDVPGLEHVAPPPPPTGKQGDR